jgi:serine/threonine protein kinase
MIVEELLKKDDRLQGKRGDYSILNLIGRGGMGAVYRARRLADNTVWALKEMRPPPHTPEEDIAENRLLFEQEAELMGSLNHPNLPVLADYFFYDDRPVMVMEFVPGQTLEDQIQEANAPLLEQQVLSYGIQLCRVLHYLHTRTPPIIYRDLKPPNIMITPRSVLKLIDFGVARTFKERKMKDTIAMGSAGYAPPEQYGKGQTDPRSDVYALGATLLHLLTNMPPVPLQTPQLEIIRNLNPSVNEQTAQIIIKAMSLDREKRFASCAEMEAALLECLDAPFVDPTADEAPPPAIAPGAPAIPVVQTEVVAPPAPAAPAAPTAAGSPVSPAPAVPPVQPGPGSIPCSNCGFFNKPTARFCSACGTPLTTPPGARLLIKAPRGSWEIKLESSTPYHIGRRDPSQNHYPEVDLAEHDRGIASRNHATIQRENDAYSLTDLGSTNGTLVNGSRISPFVPQHLRPGDIIKIGEVEMEFRWV